MAVEEVSGSRPMQESSSSIAEMGTAILMAPVHVVQDLYYLAIGGKERVSNPDSPHRAPISAILLSAHGVALLVNAAILHGLRTGATLKIGTTHLAWTASFQLMLAGLFLTARNGIELHYCMRFGNVRQVAAGVLDLAYVFVAGVISLSDTISKVGASTAHLFGSAQDSIQTVATGSAALSALLAILAAALYALAMIHQCYLSSVSLQKLNAWESAPLPEDVVTTPEQHALGQLRAELAKPQKAHVESSQTLRDWKRILDPSLIEEIRRSGDATPADKAKQLMNSVRWSCGWYLAKGISLFLLSVVVMGVAGAALALAPQLVPMMITAGLLIANTSFAVLDARELVIAMRDGGRLEKKNKWMVSAALICTLASVALPLLLMPPTLVSSCLTLATTLPFLILLTATLLYILHQENIQLTKKQPVVI